MEKWLLGGSLWFAVLMTALLPRVTLGEGTPSLPAPPAIQASALYMVELNPAASCSKKVPHAGYPLPASRKS